MIRSRTTIALLLLAATALGVRLGAVALSPASRRQPVKNLYQTMAVSLVSGNGFTASGEGLWEISREQMLALPPAPAHIALSLNDIVVPTGFPLDATAPPSNSEEQP